MEGHQICLISYLEINSLCNFSYRITHNLNDNKLTAINSLKDYNDIAFSIYFVKF